MKKSVLAILLVAACVPATVFGQAAPLDAAAYFSFLNSADKQTLLTKKELTATGASAAELPYGIKSPFAAEIASGLTVKNSSVAIEGFFVFAKPAGNVELGLYNAVNSIASMEGLPYFSVTRQRMETLVLDSYRVTALDKPQKLPDPTFAEIPAYQRAVVFQKDNKLGDGYSEVTWKPLPGGALVMTLKNLQTLNYGILPLVDPGNLQMLFVIQPLADKVAVYGIMEGKTVSLFGLERSKDESFRNRMRALAAWLGTRIAAVK